MVKYLAGNFKKGDKMSSLFGPGVMLLFFLFFAGLIFLYVMSIFWAKKDAKARGANEKFAMLISLIPFAGVLAYVLMRPPLLKIDEEEQNLDIKLKKRQLKKYDICPNCGQEIEDDYIACPNCSHKLKDVCRSCNKPLDFKWNTCPYCGEVIKKADPNIFSNPRSVEPVKDTDNAEAPKVDYKVEDSFSFEQDSVEEVDVNLNDVTQPKHHFKTPEATNTHK